MHAFYEVTIDSEGNSDSLRDYIVSLDYLYSKIDSTRQYYSHLNIDDPSDEYHQLYTSSIESWGVLENYINLCDQSAAYYAAYILDPTAKWLWVIENWGSHSEKMDWIPQVQGLVQDLWNDEYQPTIGETTVAPMYTPLDKDHPFMELYQHKRLKLYHTTPVLDPYHDYCAQPLQDGVNSLQYWSLIYTSGRQRALAQFALDMLAIPSMSSECERVFSSAKLLISDRRNRLQPDVIEANECLRSWYGRPEQGAFDVDIDDELETYTDGCNFMLWTHTFLLRQYWPFCRARRATTLSNSPKKHWYLGT